MSHASGIGFTVGMLTIPDKGHCTTPRIMYVLAFDW